ncbi:hypothetical protein HBI70_174630 [Parastagonospora nodorum]|nr:hypothetical protein HBH77_011150 [Parastagonospora nodorum]KAH5258544.1 hypothetical protein HBI70_174630 [Parastagonospora nodorum]KAH5688911.1 hypothetical protein HBI23_028310 [Parastagonospora nodorum]KAH6240138.1 hypothetical protein HBI15_021700 [Parastagonospora nodorum]KAH6436760.1 hypothetical protein HBI14_011120 [Parastagonospora nodorum]
MQNCVLQLQATTKLTRLRPPGGFSHMAACCIGYYQHTPASVWLLEQDTTIACLLCWSSYEVRNPERTHDKEKT